MKAASILKSNICIKWSAMAWKQHFTQQNSEHKLKMLMYPLTKLNHKFIAWFKESKSKKTLLSPIQTPWL
jgi:hypothetical protein